MNTAYISLGSNTGNSLDILLSAMRDINARCRITGISRLYRTTPQIVRRQPNFYNAAISIDSTPFSRPEQLLDLLHKIEADHGRRRLHESPKGPRSLDLDIIFYGSTIFQTPKLTLPHPEFQKRRFVLVPLLDIDPELRNPVDQTPLIEYEKLLKDDSTQGIYLYESDNYNSVTSALRD